jgi:hypothetical protein
MAEVVSNLIAFSMTDAAISTAFGHRIWGNKIPDLPGGGAQPYPYARMRDISDAHNYAHGGPTGRKAMVQVDIYDDDEATAKTNARLFVDLLDGYKGVMSNLTAGMVKAHRGPGTWDGSNRQYWQIVEVEVMTND